LVGIKNPNYRNINVEMLQLLCESPRITRQKLSEELSCSLPTLSKRFHTILGISNIQHLRNNKSDKELMLFFKNKLRDYQS